MSGDGDDGVVNGGVTNGRTSCSLSFFFLHQTNYISRAEWLTVDSFYLGGGSGDANSQRWSEEVLGPKATG